MTVRSLPLLLVTVSGCQKTTPLPHAPPESIRPNNTALGNSTTHSSAPTEEQTSDSAVAYLPTSESPNFVAPLADAYNRIDPEQDGWETETIGAMATETLARWGDLLAQPNTAHAEVKNLVSSTFAAPHLFSYQGPATFDDGLLQVVRTDQFATASNTGTARLSELSEEFHTVFLTDPAPHLKFKVVKVQNDSANIQTEVLFHADGINHQNQRHELSSTWTVRWQRSGSELRINSIEPKSSESVTKRTSVAPTFGDCTAAVLQDNSSYADHLLYSTDHWRSRLPRTFGLDVVANHGMAVGDINSDGLDDIYVCQQGGLPNRLFVQQADGTLVDRSAESGTDWLDYSTSALLIDLDNDGDQDLVVSLESRILLMQNDGAGHFQLAEEMATFAQTFSLAAADVDLDGDLDIYSCGYNPLGDRVRTGAMGEPIPYHDAQNGGRNMLIRNDANWNFADATDAFGLDHNNNRFSFAASWEDFDNDGDCDLYVANDYGRNNLYRNDNGQFQDVAAELGVEDMSAGMSVNWADVNRDGWMDFYVSNMFSAAGNRITFQRQFRSQDQDDVKRQFQRHARGNSLFQADGRGGFQDVSEDAGITMGRWAWGSRFCDLNNDGWEDLVVANGFISTDDTGDL
ncbi:MAG: VCBS repeat-containing protein [Planctomycetales bacterium]|nr:VCBS repeat-containing protein [Planctomycetales bacterium]